MIKLLQYSDLMRIFDRNGLPPEANYLFLGDYIDRGMQSLETICLMFCFKIKYPHNFVSATLDDRRLQYFCSRCCFAVITSARPSIASTASTTNAAAGTSP